jgi:hypothetical protein
MFHGTGYLDALAEEIVAEHRLAMKRPDRKKSVPRRKRPRTVIVSDAAAQVYWRRIAVAHALRMWPRVV